MDHTWTDALNHLQNLVKASTSRNEIVLYAQSQIPIAKKIALIAKELGTICRIPSEHRPGSTDTVPHIRELIRIAKRFEETVVVELEFLSTEQLAYDHVKIMERILDDMKEALAHSIRTLQSESQQGKALELCESMSQVLG